MGPFIVICFILFFVSAASIIIRGARRVSKFQGMVFDRIDNGLYQKIDKAEKPNKSYIKTNCDNCGAACTNAADISPSGDLKCEYCQSWFNVLRD